MKKIKNEAPYDALLITNPVNIRYLTGFTGLSPTEREAYAVETNSGERILITSELYREEAAESQRAMRVSHVIITDAAKTLTESLVPLSNRLSVRRLGFESEFLTVTEHGQLRSALSATTLVPTVGIIEERRTYKTKAEIATIRKSARVTDDVFSSILPLLTPGASEQQVAWSIASLLRERGAETAFPPIVAVGKNSSMPHYDGKRNTRITNNCLVLLDFGASLNGYASDMTRVVCVGKPKPEWRCAYGVVRKAQENALAYLRSTKSPSGAQADRTARDTIAKSGLPVYPHSLGHGVGLAIHESPRLSVKKDVILQNRMVVTVEPGVYIPGRYGIRIEDLLLLTLAGAEILSKTTKEMIIV